MHEQTQPERNHPWRRRLVGAAIGAIAVTGVMELINTGPLGGHPTLVLAETGGALGALAGFSLAGEWRHARGQESSRGD